MRVQQQPAYVLLNRPYSETSWIVEIFSRDYGRLSLMAKGARRLKSKLKGVLLPFQPLLLSWTGKGEVPTLTSAEIDGALFELTGERLICGFYCNELLVQLLHRHDPHASLFKYYHETMLLLSEEVNEATLHTLSSSALLRQFERALIRETGYDIDFIHEAQTVHHRQRQLIQDKLYYQFIAGQGFVRADKRQANSVPGHVIKSLQSNTPSTQQLAASKQIMRDIINQLLKHRKIHSRDLFLKK